ncbi:MAG: hypothetical protein ABW003_09845 [Microvirga sp.]
MEHLEQWCAPQVPDQVLVVTAGVDVQCLP